MDKMAKRVKKCSIREEDVSILLLRYSVKTVLTLLQEVAKVAGEKIDWNEIVKSTATGISSARECQMLWRHLAYGQALTDQFDNVGNPMDDDSDLEYEVEAFPAISRETSVEAAAYVKVLVASDYPIVSHVPNNLTIEAPLNINIPMFKVPLDSSRHADAIQGMNISIPVSIEKEPLTSGTCEKRSKDGKSGVDFAPRRKRRVWSTEDDAKLTAAVQKHGEQSWVNIASGDFKNDRKASELSHRWANIRKRKGKLNAGTSSELFEARMAANQASCLAIEPTRNNLKAARQINNDTQLGMVRPPKSQVPAERPSMNCSTSPNSIIRAAAGARIATPADASSVIEAAARSPNLVHIRTGANSLMKSATTTMPNQMSTNLHSSHDGPSRPTYVPISTYSVDLPTLQASEAQETQGNSIKPAGLAVQPNPVDSSSVRDVSGTVIAAASIPNIEVAKTAEVAAISTSASEMKELAQRDQGADLNNISSHAAVELISEGQSAPIGDQSIQKLDEPQTSAPRNTLGGNTQGDQASISFSNPINQTQEDQVALPCSEVEDNGKKHADSK